MRKFATTALIAAIVVVLAAAGTVAAQDSQRFSDVPTDHKAYDAIEWAATNGMTGCGDGKFCPDATVTRADLATVLYQQTKAPFSGVGDEVTDDIVLEPGYYRVIVSFFPKSGYDWDDGKWHEFAAHFKSKGDEITLVEWEESDEECEFCDKHTDLFFAEHFRVDEAGPHWFDIKTSGKMAWVAQVNRYATQPGSAGFYETDDDDSDDS